SNLITKTGKARIFTFTMEAKSVITFPSGEMRLPGAGFYEITGLAWSGRGKIARVEISTDGGKTWDLAALQDPVLPICQTRFRFPVWDGTPATLQSRATDETGYAQPTHQQLIVERGALDAPGMLFYHMNAIQSWGVAADGSVKNVHPLADAIKRIGAAAVANVLALTLANAQGYPSKFELGQPASEQEIAAIATATAADAKGLPPGRGDYAGGKQVYETACAACHGADIMGVTNIPNMPAGASLRLIGGRGTLTSPKAVATVESYWPYATTLFDYIRRAMPFTAPGSLSVDEIYAVCAYILAEATISDKATVPDVH